MVKTHEIDAEGKILGRLASEIAGLLRGKQKINFSYHIDNGDRVVISNIDKIKVTGKKMQGKIYYRHTGYPGGIRTKNLAERMDSEPEKVLRDAVYNMLPKNKLRDNMIKRLTFKK